MRSTFENILIVVLMVITLLALTSIARATVVIVPTEKIAETDLNLPFQKVKEIVASHFGAPDYPSNIRCEWSNGDYTLLVGKLDTNLTYVALRKRDWKRSIPRRTAPTVTKAKDVWTRSIGTWK